jgi:[acyl-carrier-protein] S-malonyltransferase
MNVFVCFTGQGSQKSGMCLDFLENNQYSEITRQIFSKSDKILGYKISEIMLDENLNQQLNQTINTQSSIGINAEIIWNIFLKKISDKKIDIKDQIAFIAGHSVGEYNALSAAGVFDFETKISLLHKRGLFMHEASLLNSSGMIAILGSEVNFIEKIIDQIFSEKNLKLEIANDNGAEQIVLSGKTEAIDFLEKNYKDFGMKKAIKLNVSGAFHSSLMASAEKKFAEKINEIWPEQIKIENNQLENTKILSNVTSEQFAQNDSSEIKKLLCMQITSRVRWREIMDFIFNNGITKILEIGPSPVLTNLAKKHFSKRNSETQLENFCISNLNDMEKFFETECEKFFK